MRTHLRACARRLRLGTLRQAGAGASVGLVLFLTGCSTYTRGEAIRPPDDVSGMAPTIVWSRDTGRGIDVTPTWVQDELIVSTTDRQFQMLRPDSGEREWRKRLEGSLVGRSFVIGRMAFAATSLPDGGVYGFDLAKKKIHWRVTVGEPVGEPTFFEGAVLVGTQDGAVYGLSPTDGRTIWVTNIESQVWGCSWFDPTRAILFMPGRSGRLAAIDGRSGERRWTMELDQPLGNASGDAARLLVVAGDSTLIALDPENGTRLWMRTLEFPIRAAATPVLDRIIVAGLDGHLVALDAASGETNWSLRLGGPFVSPPAVSDSMIVIGSPSGLVWLIDTRSGRVRGQFRHDEPVLVTPVVDKDLWIVAGERGLLMACRWMEAR